MSKDEIKVEFDELATKYHKNLASEVRGILYNLKATWNWTNADLAYFLDTTENRVEDILSEYWDGRMSAKTFVRIQLLTMGSFNMPGCKLTNEAKEKMTHIIAAFQETKIPPRTREEKIQDVLDLFGVTDDDSLDRLISAIVDVRKAVSSAENDMNETLDDCKCNNDCKCENTQGSVKATCYNSETMDKPKTITFNLKDFKQEDLKKFTDICKDLAGSVFNGILK